MEVPGALWGLSAAPTTRLLQEAHRHGLGSVCPHGTCPGPALHCPRAARPAGCCRGSTPGRVSWCLVLWAHSLPPLSRPSLQPPAQAHLHAQAQPCAQAHLRAQARPHARMAAGTCPPVPAASDGDRRCGPLEKAGASPERKTVEALRLARVNHITPLLHLEKPGRLAAQNNKLFHSCAQRRTRGHLKQEPAPARVQCSD